MCRHVSCTVTLTIDRVCSHTTRGLNLVDGELRKMLTLTTVTYDEKDTVRGWGKLP